MPEPEIRSSGHPHAHAYAAWPLKKTGKAYRLLIAAGWEYAAHASTMTEWLWDNEKADAKAYVRCLACGHLPDPTRPYSIEDAPLNALHPHSCVGSLFVAIVAQP
jgi:formylglycine-generating enzyme required for sulfatase activity